MAGSSQMDPFPGLLTLPDTLNPYLYTLNNPVNFVDPSGKFFFIPLLVAGLMGGFLGGVAYYTLEMLPNLGCWNIGEAAVWGAGGMLIGALLIPLIYGGQWAAPRIIAWLRPPVGHHTIPKQILNMLPKPLANAVRGKAGAPNIWQIPENLHKLIHSGPGPGGYYNAVWRIAIGPLLKRGNITEAEIYAIRDQLANAFSLWKYRP